ncbi:MAG: hypothetical protein P4L11_08455 [Geothrix sp.]|nr:hypothetical protein [Geothrix sp.]
MTPVLPAGGDLQVYNAGSSPLVSLYVTSSSSTTWGVDQLAPYSIFPGSTYDVTNLPSDLFDVQAVFSDGTVDTVFDVPIQDGISTPLTMMNTGIGAVAVFNNSAFTIDTIYLTPSTSSNWGPNQLDVPLDPGQTQTLTGLDPDTYDVRVFFTNGNYADYPGNSVTAGMVTTIQVN